MELQTKGASVPISPAFKELTIKAKWIGEAAKPDLDIVALYKDKSGAEACIYYGDKGNLTEFPNMLLLEDQGTEDAPKGMLPREETMMITSFEGLEEIRLIIWDYSSIVKSVAPLMGKSQCKITMDDGAGTVHEVKLDVGANDDLAMCNIIFFAKIDLSGPIPKLINTSFGTNLKGLKNTNELWAIVQKENL